MRRPTRDRLATATRAKARLLHRLERTPPSEWPPQISRFVANLGRLQIVDRASLLTLFTDLAQEIRPLAAQTDPAYASREYRLRAFWKAARASTDDEMFTGFERELLAWLTQSLRRQRPSSPHVQHVKVFVRDHYHEPLTLDSIAVVVGRQPRYLARVFRQEVGLTIHQYLTSVRLHRAWALIRGGVKIDAVTLLVGYRSKKSFYRQFKAHVGIPPAECLKLP